MFNIFRLPGGGVRATMEINEAALITADEIISREVFSRFKDDLTEKLIDKYAIEAVKGISIKSLQEEIKIQAAKKLAKGLFDAKS